MDIKDLSLDSSDCHDYTVYAACGDVRVTITQLQKVLFGVDITKRLLC